MCSVSSANSVILSEPGFTGLPDFRLYCFLYTYRTAGAWLLDALTFLYTYRTAGAAKMGNKILFL